MLARYEIPVYDILVDGAGAPILMRMGRANWPRLRDLIPSTTASFGVGSETGPIARARRPARHADDSAAIAVTDMGLFAANAIPVGARVIQADMTYGSLHHGQLVVSYASARMTWTLKSTRLPSTKPAYRELGGVGADVVAQGITT